MKEVLLDCLDCCYVPNGVWVFAVSHESTEEVSVVVPNCDNYFNYLGLDNWDGLKEVGDKVVTTDNDGESHTIIRIY